LTAIEDNPVVTFRTHWQTLQSLDSLAQLEGRSRNKIINTAVMQYVLDYLGARGHTPPGYLRTRIRMIQVLQKRLEINMALKDKRVLEDFERDRQEMLEEAYRYARYTKNQASLLLLSKVSSWLATTFDHRIPADMKRRATELSNLLETLEKTHSVEPKETKP
jgi:hypothetical protein